MRAVVCRESVKVAVDFRDREPVEPVPPLITPGLGAREQRGPSGRRCTDPPSEHGRARYNQKVA
ncbi:MAG: hypothetical protein JWM85_970 [Acidimicrobiaceae bacterium]|nr:hypothetical protein [Acidimicrobiaceae bacterium]